MRTSTVWARERVLDERPDVLFTSDYLDASELRAVLPRGWRDVPILAYFHESQATYPLGAGERVDHQFAFTNLASARAADVAAFNSEYHRQSFFRAMDELAQHVPDVDFSSEVRATRERSVVLPLGTDTPLAAPQRVAPGERPRVVWPHRAEADKGPDRLLATVRALADEEFELHLVGPRFRERPAEFEELARLLGPRLVEHGFVPSREDYLAVLRDAHLSLSTAKHEFFGIAALESLRSGCVPVWPRDLAYPELLRADDLKRWTYEPAGDASGGAARGLRRTLELVNRNEHLEHLAIEQRASDSFSWPHRIECYDAALEQAVRPPAD